MGESERLDLTTSNNANLGSAVAPTFPRSSAQAERAGIKVTQQPTHIAVALEQTASTQEFRASLAPGDYLASSSAANLGQHLTAQTHRSADISRSAQSHSAGAVHAEHKINHEQHPDKPWWKKALEVGGKIAMAPLLVVTSTITVIGFTVVSLAKGVASGVQYLSHAENRAAMWEGIKSSAGAIFGFFKDIVANPGRALETAKRIGLGALEIGKSILDGLGLTDIGSGLWKAAFSPGHRKEGLQQIWKGLGTMVESTGIKDLAIFLKCAALGDIDGAKKHLGGAIFGLFSVGALVFTGGAINGVIMSARAGSIAWRQAAVECCKLAGKGIGEAVIGKLDNELAPKALQEFAVRNADEGGAELFKLMRSHLAGSVPADQLAKMSAEEIGRRAAKVIDPDTITRVLDQVAEKNTLELLKERLPKVVSDLTYDFLNGAQNKKLKDVAKQLQELGVQDPKQAKRMAKRLQAVLRNGKADDELAEALSNEISDEVLRHMREHTEGAFRERFGLIVRGQLDTDFSEALGSALRENSKRLGRNIDELADEYVEAGWRGFDRGMSRAVRKLVREGVDDAFRRLREEFQTNSSTPTPHKKEEEKKLGAKGQKGQKSKHAADDGHSKGAAEEGLADGPERTRTQRVVNSDGSEDEVFYVERGGEWIEQGRERLVDKTA